MTHKIIFAKVDSEGTQHPTHYLVRCDCGFTEASTDKDEIQELAKKHRDLYILKK